MTSQCSHVVSLFDAGQKQRLFMNMSESMASVPTEIVERQLGLLEQVHPEYAAGVRHALSLTRPA